MEPRLIDLFLLSILTQVLIQQMQGDFRGHLQPGPQGKIKVALTYFQNQQPLMKHAEHLKQNLPLGSGVTEAACKTIVAQPFILTIKLGGKLNTTVLRQEWFSNVRGDILAGTVVGLALIPEAIAFSIIAGVDPKVGAICIV